MTDETIAEFIAEAESRRDAARKRSDEAGARGDVEAWQKAEDERWAADADAKRWRALPQKLAEARAREGK